MRWMVAVSVSLLVSLRAGASEPKLHGRPIQQVLTCCLNAAARARIPPEILLAVAELEGGRPGQWVRNKNGSYDVGPMQFNTRYLKSLRHHGITAEDVQDSSCYPYELAAWRLGRHLRRDHGDLYTRAANYHSRSPRHNHTYRSRLIPRAQKWQRWLENRAAGYRPVRANPPSPGARATHREEVDLVALLEAEQETPREAARDGQAQPSPLEPVPQHSGYRLRAPERSWGTTETIRHLTEAFDRLPSGSRAVVLDVSLPGGGPMPRHKSHRHGRDVDISYFRRCCGGAACMARTTRAGELDAARQWRLLEALLPHAQYIFVSYALQRPLYEVARGAGASVEALARWFQYPRGRDDRAGIIRHAPHHGDHLHVRFRCIAAREACTDEDKQPAESGDLASEDEGLLLRLLRSR
jgi:hypothetical protein